MNFASKHNAQSAQAQERKAAMLQAIEQWRGIEARAAYESAKAQASFAKRGQLLPRERVALLLDPGAPWLGLMGMAGYLQDIGQDAASQAKDEPKSVPGGGMIAGIGFVSGVRCMVVASDSAIEAGAIQPGGLEKILRVQELALQNKLPFVHLVESAGANLLRYDVRSFVHGGALFRNLARLSAAGLPVLTVQHGAGTAGGAYMPGLSDVVIMVRGRSRAYLAGPALLKAATGEVADDEELGGAQMHTSTTGLGEYLVEDDRQAVGLARQLVAGFCQKNGHKPSVKWASSALNSVAKQYGVAAQELLTLMPVGSAVGQRAPVDMREVMLRLADDAQLLEFKAEYGMGTPCAQARMGGHAVGFISNNGPIDVAGANKATHFIQLMCQLGHPIIYLQNTTGYIVGKDSEQAGMIKHGSKMIQAVTNANVPQITIQCGASFGAGNYGMCGRAYAPRFLFSWPAAQTAVMGGVQAARTMREVITGVMAKRGMTPSPEQVAKLDAQEQQIIALFDQQQPVLYTSGAGLDDGIIDPRDTREVLIECLNICAESAARQPRPVQFGVARM
jgi:geranyl-CoA carboxylase beta subunit